MAAEISTVVYGVYEKLFGLLEHPDLVSFVPENSVDGRGCHLLVYMDEIVARSRATLANLVLSGVFINRFMTAHPRARAKRAGAHRIFLTALMVACKYNEDITYTNHSWAIIGHYFPLPELNRCERELLAFIRFRVRVTVVQFDEALAHFKARAIQHTANDAAAAAAAVQAPEEPVVAVIVEDILADEPIEGQPSDAAGALSPPPAAAAENVSEDTGAPTPLTAPAPSSSKPVTPLNGPHEEPSSSDCLNSSASEPIPKSESLGNLAGLAGVAAALNSSNSSNTPLVVKEAISEALTRSGKIAMDTVATAPLFVPPIGIAAA